MLSLSQMLSLVGGIIIGLCSAKNAPLARIVEAHPALWTLVGFAMFCVGLVLHRMAVEGGSTDDR